MSIQRWGLGDNAQIIGVYGGEGEFVFYSAHLAALAEAEHEDKCNRQRAHREGRAEALQEVREALELLPVSLVDTRFDPDDERRYVQAVRLTSALAAIDAVGVKP